MVNVGGRSKGCSTCRRRRVKCDETKPVCKRCQKGEFECDGPRGVAFIADTIVKSRRSSGTKGTACIAPAAKSAIAKEKDVIRYQRVKIVPPLKGDEFELYICYSRTRLRPGAAIDRALQTHNLSDLITAGQRPLQARHKPGTNLSLPKTTATTTTNLFPLTLLAFATLLHGTHHHHIPTTQKGYTLHQTALKTLNAALSHPSTHTSDTLLLSVATLAILECLVPTSPHAYLNHMLGLTRLLELRDPTDPAHVTPLSVALYKSMRHMVLFAALMVGRGCVFARGEWKVVLRGACVSMGERRQQDLFDVLADCSVLCEGRDRLVRGEGWWDEEGFERVREGISRRALGLRGELLAWRWSWVSSGEGRYTEVRTVSPAAASATSPFEEKAMAFTVFQFSSEDAAGMFMLYNTALIHVLRILSSLPARNQMASPATSVLSTVSIPAYYDTTTHIYTDTHDDYIAAERAAALDTCRCLPYYVACTPVHTSPVVHWAATTAWATLRKDEFAEGKAMMEWLRTQCREVTATGLWAGLE